LARPWAEHWRRGTSRVPYGKTQQTRVELSHVRTAVRVLTLRISGTIPGAVFLPHTGPVESAADSVAGRIQPLARRRSWTGRPWLTAGPSDQALLRLAGWYAIALRLGGAALFSAVAVLAATQRISGWWLGVLLTALCLWSAFFTWRIRRAGLTTTVVLADTVVISALALAQQHLVPAVLIKDDTTWMLPLACTSVYILQIALRPWLGLPGAAIVVIAYGLGTGHPGDAWLLVVEAIVAAGLMAVIRGGARQADAIVAAGLETERRVRAEEARRADEREQHRQLHDTVLSTLTMVAAGAFAGPSAALTAQANRDLRVLQGLAAAPAVGALPDGPGPLTDLRPQLERAVASTADLAVRLKLVPVTLPSPVADQLVACVGEALRNVERHAGTGRAEVTVSGGAGWAVVKIADRGRGFDPDATPPSRRGIRESITGRMLAAGGRAAIASRPGAGTTVTVSWPA
jgi:signal transduction histidine kinase